MLYLYTGLPGSKKTANVVHRLTSDPMFKDRPIFYFNLKSCTIDDWIEIDESQAKAWYELPEGSVIFFDEAQKLYRPQKWDKNKPQYYTQLEEHRHKGFDIFLTTQHPMFIDTHVRRLVDEHRHLHNAFGIRSISYTWPRCKDDPEASFFEGNRENAQVPKSVFSLYQSTVINTNKKRIPKKLYYIGILALLVFSAFGYLYTRFTPDKDNLPNTSQNDSYTNSPLAAVSALTQPRQSDRVMTTDEYIEQFTPRIPAIPWSAPAYDEIMKPTVAPVPHCVVFDNRGSEGRSCRCWTQQMTKISMPDHDCFNIVERGLWNPAPRTQTAEYSSSGDIKSYNNRPFNM